MRRFSAAAILSAVVTFVVALALRAPGAAGAVLAIAGITAVTTWFAAQHSTDDESGLAIANPASAVAFVLVGRSPVATILPLIAAQVIGALVGGVAALGLAGHLGETLLWPEPTLIATGVVIGVVGVIATWLVFALDQQIGEGWAGVPPLLVGASLPVNLAGALNPAVAIGLATANLITWPVAAVAVIASLIAAVIGAYSASLVAEAE